MTETPGRSRAVPVSSPAIERTLEEVLSDGVFLCLRFGPGAPVLEAARAAVRGGLRVLEMTLTTPGALDAMRVLSRDPGVIIGGGTVLSPALAREVARSGGRFVLSPVFDPEVVDEAERLGLLGVPGAATPKEILAAHRHGARMVKVFPAGALGGPAFLRAVRGPLPDVLLVPTNGPTSDTLADYLSAGAAMVGIGGEVYPPGFTLDGVEAAARRVRQAMDACRREGRGPA
jgi:2-dehydro-3-deoxyphosphogluconate aldolase/(4S)-4-hydroxy-2-oxoglutarate aldolase